MIRFPLAATALALLIVLCAPVMHAAGTPEAAGEQPTLVWLTSVQGGREPEENTLFQKEVERLTGVKVSLIKPPGSEYTTKLTAMLATGEPLDIAYVGDSTFESLYEQNLFASLTDLIGKSKVLSDTGVIAKSEWDRIRRSDGNIYGIFNKFEQGTMPVVRADWMRKLGIGDPETFDDYYNMLKAFTVKDPDGNGKNDTYGMAIGFTTYDLSGLFGAYGLMRGFAKDAGGNLYSPWGTEAAIPVYDWMARLYREGILEPNFITNGSANFRDLFMTDKSGMNFYWAAWVGLYNQQVKASNPSSPFEAKGLKPPAGPAGRLLRAGGDGLMVSPKVSPNRELAFKVMEFWHTEPGNVLSTFGILDHDYTFAGGKYALTEVGKAHAMDHGAPQPKSLKWKNPLGEAPGYEAAAAIIREYARPQMVTPHDKQWEEITRSEAAKIILGDISAKDGIANMQKRFKAEGILK